MIRASRAARMLILSLLVSGTALTGAAVAQTAAPAPDRMGNVVAAQGLLQAARAAHDQGDAATAIQKLEAMLALEYPDDPAAQRLAAGACLLLAEVRREAGDLPAAKIAAADGVARCGDEPSELEVELLRLLSRLCTELGELDAAAQHAQNAEELAAILKN